MAEKRIEVHKESQRNFPSNLTAFINRLCELRGEVPAEYRDAAEIEFDYSEYGCDIGIEYRRPETAEEIAEETSRRAAWREARRRSLEAELAGLR